MILCIKILLILSVLVLHRLEKLYRSFCLVVLNIKELYNAPNVAEKVAFKWIFVPLLAIVAPVVILGFLKPKTTDKISLIMSYEIPRTSTKSLSINRRSSKTIYQYHSCGCTLWISSRGSSSKLIQPRLNSAI